jgi:Zn-dependent peptidase ImmA (M78 family)
VGRGDYYNAMKVLAAERRAHHEVNTSSFGLRKVRSIYAAESITIDMWDLSSRIRAVYMCEDGECSVLVSRSLPKEPRLFALVHELKHHYCDRATISAGRIQCGDYNANEVLEIGAEIFAAEFIYPEREFLDCLPQVGITQRKCTAEQVVELKRKCGAPVSYQFLIKRLEWLRYAAPGAFKGVKFRKLEEEIHGPPLYKQEWFKRYRARKRQRE